MAVRIEGVLQVGWYFFCRSIHCQNTAIVRITIEPPIPEFDVTCPGPNYVDEVVKFWGGTQLFFGGYVSRRFPKIGSRERILLEKWGVFEWKFRKFLALRAEILTKNRAENARFVWELKMGGIWAAHWWYHSTKLISKSIAWILIFSPLYPLAATNKFPRLVPFRM